MSTVRKANIDSSSCENGNLAQKKQKSQLSRELLVCLLLLLLGLLLDRPGEVCQVEVVKRHLAGCKQHQQSGLIV